MKYKIYIQCEKIDYDLIFKALTDLLLILDSEKSLILGVDKI